MTAPCPLNRWSPITLFAVSSKSRYICLKVAMYKIVFLYIFYSGHTSLYLGEVQSIKYGFVPFLRCHLVITVFILIEVGDFQHSETIQNYRSVSRRIYMYSFRINRISNKTRVQLCGNFGIGKPVYI